VIVNSPALLPLYAAAATAVVVLLLDLLRPGSRASLLVVGAIGTLVTAARSLIAGAQPGVVCVGGGSCSFVHDRAAVAVIVAFCVITLVVLALSVPAVTRGDAPPGEYVFLLMCSLLGGVVLAGARDLLTLIVALETLTLPVYILVAMRRRDVRSIEAATTFFVVSVVSTAVTLMGAGLLYAVTGAVHFDGIREALPDTPLAHAAAGLVLVGLAFKVSVVPFHAWAPGTYDGAPLPIAAYLSSASKLGGVVALVLVVTQAVSFAVAGPLLAVAAALTMTVGNLVALRQTRMVRLLAWSSVAQAGYILAPLAGDQPRAAVVGVAAYTAFYLLINLGAFAAIVAWRGAGEGGEISSYRGLARRSPWVAGAFVLALAGLAGLPPGLAGLFAKITIVRSLLDGSAGWLAVVVGLNAVIGLAYYAKVAAVLFGPPGESAPGEGSRPGAVVALALAAAAVVVGFVPQLVLDVAGVVAEALGTGGSG
jgi:NADH-quinone oxidoreductase subunit N